MKVTIVYFSQTGNTRSIAQAMETAFRAAGHQTHTLALKKAAPQDVATSDVLGVGTPCFSSQAPTPVKDFLRTLPPLENRRAFVFATSGGAPGRVLYELTCLLQEKGAEVIGGFLARGETYHPAPCLTGRLPNRPDEADLTRARDFATAISEHMTSGQSGPATHSRPDAFKPQGWFYNLVAKVSTDGVLRFLEPEPNVDPTRCTQCGWCVAECPMQTITLAPYPVLGAQCIRCYRCLTGCPQKAYTANWALGNIITWSLYNETFERWFGDLAPGEELYAEKQN